jgi:hypothetical protein
MIKALQNKYLILEQNRERLYDQIEKLDVKQLNYRPLEGKWSIIQIIFHIIKAEQITVISINKEIRNTANKTKFGLYSLIRSFLLRYALRSPLKFKAPPLLRNIPSDYDIHELKTKWITVRSKLHNALGEITDESAKKYMFEHPYAGRLSIYQTMDFLVEHFNHHYRLIKRLAA